MRYFAVLGISLSILCAFGKTPAHAACTAAVTPVNLGTLDPSLPAPATVTGACSVSVSCAPPASVDLLSVTSSNANNMAGPASHLIPYTFIPGIASPTTNPNVRKNAPWVINCGATVSNYQQAWSDSSIAPTQYADTVVYSFTSGGTPFSATIPVPAAVLGQCKATGGLTQTISFGTVVVDATTGDQTRNLASASLQCTNGLPYDVSYTSGNAFRMLYTDAGSANHYLNYTFTPSTAAGPRTGAGFAGAAVPIGGSVSVPGINFQNAFTDSSTAGASYQDVISVNIAF